MTDQTPQIRRTKAVHLLLLLSIFLAPFGAHGQTTDFMIAVVFFQQVSAAR
jgi:hypothetical protein